MKAIIISGGNRPSKELLLKYIEAGDYIIGADKGCDALYEYNIKPDLIIGDFDSAKKEVINSFKNSGFDVITLNPEKDYADTYLAYEKAVEKGYKKVLFFGVTGTRMDHSLGNVGILMKALNEGIEAEIIDEHNRSFLINKKTILKGEYKETVSLIPLSEKVENVTIKGAKYTLDNYTMTLLEPRAICNEFLHEDIEISFDSGIIMIIFPKD